MFQWNFTGGQNAYDAAQQAAMKQKAAIDMQGYAPNGPEATYAAQNMQGYNPNNTYLGRVSDRAGQPGSGQGYQFSDPEFEQYQQSQAKAEQEAAQKEERINQIKSEIASLQQSIAEKETRLKNFTGSVDEIAALEAEKINSQDPTMIWRWQKQREDTSKANEKIKANDAEKFKNTVEMYKNQLSPETSDELTMTIRNLETAIRDGENLGQDTSELRNMLREYQAIKVQGGPMAVNARRKLNDLLNNPEVTVADLVALQPMLNMDDQVLANKKIYELQENAKNKAKKKAKDDKLKGLGF